MAQFARPDSDITNNGNNGFGAIDEASASDADFWYGDNNQADELEVSLTNVTDPATSSGHTFRYRVAKTNAGTVDGGGNAVTVTARLMQGTTQIATDTAKTATGTWTQYAYTLSGAEADAITDYNDLRLEFVTSQSGGSPSNRRGGAVSWAELEVPDATLSVSTNAIAGGTSLFQHAVSPGPVTVVTETISATSLFQPLVAQLLVTNTIAQSVTIYDPTVTASNIVVTQFLGPTTALNDPTVIYHVQVPLLASEAVLWPPSGIHSVVMDAIAGGTALFEPSAAIAGGDAQTVVMLAIANTTVFAPTGVTQQVVTSLIANSTQAFSPTVVQAVAALAIGAGTTVYSPTLTTQTNVAALAIASGTTVHAPMVSGGAQQVRHGVLPGVDTVTVRISYGKLQQVRGR